MLQDVRDCPEGQIWGKAGNGSSTC